MRMTERDHLINKEIKTYFNRKRIRKAQRLARKATRRNTK